MTEHQKGLLYAITAFLMWGFIPLYWKLLDHIPSPELLSHRIIWSCVFLYFLTHTTKGYSHVKHVFSNASAFKIVAATTVMIGGSWFVYIWAVTNGFVLETSLGYYINPLLNVVLGFFLLKERLSQLEWFAVGLAFLGIAYRTISIGQLPWISLALAISFAFYGLLKKKLECSAIVLLFIETLLLSPFAILYLIYLGVNGELYFFTIPWTENLLILGAGIATSLPLIFFTMAAKRISLTTLGFIQFFSPTIQFVLAVYLFGEPFETAHLIMFLCIWTALIIYSSSMVKKRRLAK